MGRKPMKVTAARMRAMLSVVLHSSREKPLVFVDAISSCLGGIRLRNSRITSKPHCFIRFIRYAQNPCCTRATVAARTWWGADILHRREGERQRQSTTVQRTSIGLL